MPYRIQCPKCQSIAGWDSYFQKYTCGTCNWMGDNPKDFESAFSTEDIRAFEWKDIHGKNLKIFVQDDENGICVSGIDEDANIYVLYNKVREEVEVIESPSNETYIKLAEESNEKIKKNIGVVNVPPANYPPPNNPGSQY